MSGKKLPTCRNGIEYESLSEAIRTTGKNYGQPNTPEFAKPWHKIRNDLKKYRKSTYEEHIYTLPIMLK